MSKICRHCYVSGKVQGVFYRQNTKQQAKNLNLTGWVKNLTDGRVELVVCGDEENVNKLLAWLPEGPPSAKVDDIVTDELEYQEYTGFKVK